MSSLGHKEKSDPRQIFNIGLISMMHGQTNPTLVNCRRGGGVSHTYNETIVTSKDM